MPGSQRTSPATASALVILLGLSVAYFTWATTSNAELEQKRAQFEQRAKRYRLQLEACLQQQTDLLLVLSRVYARDDDVTESDLQEFVSRPLTTDPRYGALRTVAWVTRVRQGDLRAYERIKRLETAGGVDFTVHGLDGRPVEDDDDHAVVDQVFPHLSYQSVLGLDLSTLPSVNSALKSAARDNERALIPLQESLAGASAGNQRFLMVAIPVQTRGQSGLGTAAAGAGATGWMTGIFGFEDLLKQALASEPGDNSLPGVNVAVFVTADNSLLDSVGDPPLADGLSSVDTIETFGRIWRVEVTVAERALLTVDDLLQRPSSLLTASVCIMMLLFAWIAWTLSRQNVVIQQRVAQQTAELLRKNLVLEGKERELNEANRRLLGMSNTDPLTGILNRRAFEVQLDKERERSNRTGIPFGLLIFDVDQFKDYNDRYGHATGDEVLRRVAGIINAEARRIDTVARYGGEEFVVLATGSDAAGLLALGERIRGRIQDAGIEHASAPKGVITVSGGGSLSSAASGHDPRTAFEIADRCMYEAKSTGRNRVVMVM